MSWYEWSAASQRSGTAAVVTQIESMLTAHAAWEFVETVTQTHRSQHSASGTFYDGEVYTCRVWKNLGTLNGYGKDFYVAIITSVVRSVKPDDFGVQNTEDQNAVWFLPFEEWNTTTKKMRRPAGYDYSSYGPSGTTDNFLSAANDYAINGNLWFNLIEAQVADDSSAWGNFSWWGRSIGTVPSNLKNEVNIWDVFYEPFIRWENYWWAEQSDGTPPDPEWVRIAPDDNPVKVWIRVTNQGILIYSTSYNPAGSVGNGQVTGGYVGLGIESHRPEQIQTGFPLMYGYSLWMNEYGSSPPFSRYPEWGDTLAIDFFEPMQVYDFAFTIGADRAHASHPGLDEWPVIPAKVIVSPANSDSYDGLIYDPGFIIPGLYWLSQEGGAFLEGDTIEGPDGQSGKLLPWSYNMPQTNPSSVRWSIVDTGLS